MVWGRKEMQIDGFQDRGVLVELMVGASRGKERRDGEGDVANSYDPQDELSAEG